MSSGLYDIPYPEIPPVTSVSPRTFWSVMIPTYNCAGFLRRTLASVLAQDPGPDAMQIEVIDDCSTKDDPEAVVAELGEGRVAFFRQPSNAGAQATFTTCIRRARGEWVHILHGDDMVLPGYYSRIRAAAEKEPRIEAAFCRYIFMDEDDHWQRLSELERRSAGILADWLEQSTVSNRIMFPAISVKRRVYERIGGFHPSLIHSADWDMWKRVYLNAVMWYEPEPLALYRVHSSSDSSKLERTGANVADSRASIELSRRQLPPAVAAQYTAEARDFLARSALSSARRMIVKGAPSSAVMAQIREGVKTSFSPAIAREVSSLLIWAGVRGVMHALAATRPGRARSSELGVAAPRKDLAAEGMRPTLSIGS